MTRGLILGKFMPLHRGHELLIRFGLRSVDELVVVVCSTDREPIPGRLRFEWVKQTFPEARVVHLHKDLPQEPAEHPDFWAIWRHELKAVAGGPVDMVFTSEDYGDRLAAELGALHVMVDRARATVPTSGTQIRAAPRATWGFISKAARPYFVKRVAIVGPESTGKSTMARHLAADLGTVHVEEYGRTVWDAEGGKATPDMMSRIAHGHRAIEEAAEQEAVRFLISDTDAMTTAWWSRELLGAVPADVEAMGREPRYALHLLLDVDVPWVQDGTRFFKDRRQRAFEDFKRMLDDRAWPYRIIRGGWTERQAEARRAVEELDRPEGPRG